MPTSHVLDKRVKTEIHKRQILRKLRKRLWLGLIPLLLACGGVSWLSPDPAPSPTSDLTRFEVRIQTDSSPTPPVEFALTPTPLPLLLTDTPSSPALPPSPPPAASIPTPTFAPPPLETPISDAVGPTNPSPEAAPPAETPLPIQTPGTNVYTGDISDQIVLLSPDPAYALPPDQNQLELKWQWLGTALRPCQLVEGHGFDIRIWPAPNNPNVPEAQRAEIEPLGVIDAIEEQDTIVASCDPRNSTRRFTINGLKQTPGVAMANGQGQFFWDVAYVQLEPFYTTLLVSPPRDFFIPPGEAVVATSSPAPSPTPTFQLTPGPRPAGMITLLDPAGNPTFPANVGPVEFRWKWAGQEGASCQLPAGYGFELRLGSTQPGLPAMGVFDAAQGLPPCDPSTGIFSYTVPDLKTAAGVKATYMGESRWDGQFFWDVVLVSTNPYQAPGPNSITSPPGHFEISLSDYTGSFDPNGEPLECRDVGAWTEAQAIFLAAGGPANDPHDFDPDGNQIACDALRE